MHQKQMKTIENHLLEHLNEFIGFARKRLRDPELAAEAVQESLLKGLHAEAQIQDAEKTKAWFYRILRRTIVDLYRRRDARDRALAQSKHELNSPPDTEEERIVCACMERLLPAMNPQYALLINRLDLNEEAPDTVATSLAISRNNLNVRAHRTRQQQAAPGRNLSSVRQARLPGLSLRKRCKSARQNVGMMGLL